MQTVEYDGLPAGTVIKFENILVIGTGPIQKEKESA
jgi:hypothetical protein